MPGLEGKGCGVAASTPTYATLGYERHTHIQISDCPTLPLHHLRSAHVRMLRARPPHITAAKFYQKEVNSFPHSGEHITPYTHTRTLHQHSPEHLPR